MPDSNLLIYAHIGDLHLTGPDQANARDLAAIVDELKSFENRLDFVFVPGDNADNGRPEQYELARRLLSPLGVPVHVITGDHDMEGGSLDAFYAGLRTDKLPRAVDAGGIRCLFIDMCGSGTGGPDFRLGDKQLAWLRTEIEEAGTAGRDCAIFMHTYPADLTDDRERDGLNAALAARPVLLADMGHTHYNEISNDGRTIFAATRSTGQIEEGPVGYALVTVDARTVSWRFRATGSNDPIVLITHPADRRLATDRGDAGHLAIGTTCDVRASVLGPAPVESCTCQIDDGPALPMAEVGPGRFSVETAIPSTARRLGVTVRTAEGVGSETIELAQDHHFAQARRADGSDADAVDAWPERGILGTQLGPNRNGRQW